MLEINFSKFVNRQTGPYTPRMALNLVANNLENSEAGSSQLYYIPRIATEDVSTFLSDTRVEGWSTYHLRDSDGKAGVIFVSVTDHGLKARSPGSGRLDDAEDPTDVVPLVWYSSDENRVILLDEDFMTNNNPGGQTKPNYDEGKLPLFQKGNGMIISDDGSDISDNSVFKDYFNIACDVLISAGLILSTVLVAKSGVKPAALMLGGMALSYLTSTIVHIIRFTASNDTDGRRVKYEPLYANGSAWSIAVISGVATVISPVLAIPRSVALISTAFLSATSAYVLDDSIGIDLSSISSAIRKNIIGIIIAVVVGMLMFHVGTSRNRSFQLGTSSNHQVTRHGQRYDDDLESADHFRRDSKNKERKPRKPFFSF